jgi:transcriptional regulator with XRE-family HTH domain
VPVRSATAQQALDALAARLREIRKDAELTARQVAQAAGWHESKCSRIEHARTTPSPADIRVWCAICGVPDQAADLTATVRSIESMYVEWRRMIRSGMRRLQEAPLPLYERTRQFRIYEPGVIPGLFQTAEYARARMGRIVEFNGIPDDLDTAVAARLERQRVLRRGDHKFAVVLEEWALRSRIGSTAMMAGQLAHLRQASTLPAVGLGIIPVSAARTMWSSPGFWIFDESRVLIETPAAELAITQPRQIAIYLRTFAELAAMAVYGSQARELINRAIADFR